MGLQYLDLVNSTLSAMNEVEVASVDFAATRGIQSNAKRAVKFAVDEINQAEFEWPFNSSERSETLVVGQTVYLWQSDFKKADWESFRLIKASGVLDAGKRLKFIDREEYYDKYLTEDEDAGASGLAVPEYVAPGHGTGFIVSPSPDAAYTLRYRYWLTRPTLSAATDDTRIPDDFERVVVDGALARMFAFKNNAEMAGFHNKKFEEGLKDMRTLLINQYDRMRDSRLPGR